MSSEFDKALKSIQDYMWARNQVGSGIYETRLVRQGAYSYEVPTERAKALQKEMRRLIDSRNNGTSEEVVNPAKELSEASNALLLEVLELRETNIKLLLQINESLREQCRLHEERRTILEQRAEAAEKELAELQLKMGVSVQ